MQYFLSAENEKENIKEYKIKKIHNLLVHIFRMVDLFFSLFLCPVHESKVCEAFAGMRWNTEKGGKGKIDRKE